MLLASEGNRPPEVTTIYRIDVDPNAVTQQLKLANETLKTAIENNNLTVSVREPTQSQLAALIISATDLTLRLDKMWSLLKSQGQNLGLSVKDIEIDAATGDVGLNIEEYQSSAFKKQVSFDVSALTE